MRKVERRLEDILEAIDRIESRVEGLDEEAFRNREMVQIWVVHHLQIIGEARRKLPDDLKDEHPEVPWKAIIGMRHYLVHEYFRVDVDTTWNVVTDELDGLRSKIQIVLDRSDEL